AIDRGAVLGVGEELEEAGDEVFQAGCPFRGGEDRPHRSLPVARQNVLLDPVHGGVGGVNQGGRAVIAAARDGNTDAGGHVEFRAVRGERVVEDGGQAGHDDRRVGGALEVFADDDELVATPAAQGVRRS